MNNSITFGPTGMSGPIGVSGIQNRIWNRVIKINKLRKIWDLISVI